MKRVRCGDKRLRALWSVPVAAALLLLLFLSACNERKPLRIGYLGSLTGKGAGLGIGGRNGAQLAVEEINRTGGIGGRPLTLQIEDDGQDPQLALAAVQRLIDAGVVTIVGPMTSSMAAATLALANEQQMLLFSPTCSSEELTGLDDYFYRMHAPIGDLARQLAKELYERRGVRRVVVVVDQGNISYTGSYYEQFRQSFVARGGEVVTTVNFVSMQHLRYSDLAAKALTASPEALLLLTNAVDTALIAQQVRKRGAQPLLAGSEWSSTSELITLGGRTVEGLISIHGVDSNGTQPRFQQFVRAYTERFGERPAFPAIYSYETVMVLAQALRQDSTPEHLRATIFAIGNFEGLQGPIAINRFGDPVRPAVPLVVADGRFVAGRLP